MPSTHRDSNSLDCNAYAARLQRFMDGVEPVSILQSDHLMVCPSCQGLADAARLFMSQAPVLAAKVPVPVDFASRVVPMVLEDRRRSRARQRTMIAFAASIAASLVIAVVSLPRQSPTHEPVARNPQPRSLENPPPIEATLREARMAFVSLTRRAAEESLTPARNLLSSVDIQSPATTPTPSRTLPPDASTIQPITETAKRALNLFIRDVGALAPISQMKS